MVRKHRSRLRLGTGSKLVAVGAGVALLASAFATSAASSASTSSNVLGTAHAATESTLKVGYITDGENGSVDNLSEIPAAQAAVKYANDYLGGAGGHKLTLDVCNDGDTPAGATDCANQMITDKVPIVLNNVDGQGGTIYSGLSAAGVPFLAYQSAVQATLTGKLSYVLSNAIASSFAGPAKLAQKVKAKRAAVFVIDVPAASGPAEQLDPIVYKNAGIPVDVVAIAPGTPDMTPQVQAEISKGVDFIQVFGDVSFCTSALKAMQTLGYKGSTALIAQCLAAGSAAGIPGGYKGDKVVTVASTTNTDPDVKIYEAAMKKWAPGTGPFANGVTQGGFATVWAFALAMKGLKGAPTSTNIEATLANMAPEPLPFGAGGTFQCNGKQVSIVPDVCSPGALSVTVNEAGIPVGKYTPLNTSALLKL